MNRHPAGKRRVAGLVSEARRHQARDVAARLLVDVEEFLGGPVVVPESVEVAQSRMDDEACELGSLNAAPRRPELVPEMGPVSLMVGAVKAFSVGVVGFAAIWVTSMAGAVAGGWPL